MTGDNFSWGEEFLIPGKGTEKEQGTKAFLDGKYEDAINHFRKYLNDNRNDPEALIYLNNAIAATSKNNPIRTVEFDTTSHDRKPFTGIGVLVKVENSAPEPDFVILKKPER